MTVFPVMNHCYNHFFKSIIETFIWLIELNACNNGQGIVESRTPAHVLAIDLKQHYLGIKRLFCSSIDLVANLQIFCNTIYLFIQ